MIRIIISLSNRLVGEYNETVCGMSGDFLSSQPWIDLQIWAAMLIVVGAVLFPRTGSPRSLFKLGEGCVGFRALLFSRCFN